MKISVVTAVFNAANTIEDTLRSVDQQDFEDIEHIVVDGASQDGTLDVLRRYYDKIDVLVSERDKGIYDALNKGVGLATGDVIGFLHADDLFADAHVVSKIAARFSGEMVDAVYGDLVYVSRRDPARVIRYWRAGEYSRERLARGWMAPHPTFYVRRSVYEDFGAFDTSHRIAADYDCMLRFLAQGRVMPAYIPEVLVKMRTGGASNRSIGNVMTKMWEDYRALRQNQVGGLISLAWKNLSKIEQFW